jgi:hypothetical protein
LIILFWLIVPFVLIAVGTAIGRRGPSLALIISSALFALTYLAGTFSYRLLTYAGPHGEGWGALFEVVFGWEAAIAAGVSFLCAVSLVVRASSGPAGRFTPLAALPTLLLIGLPVLETWVVIPSVRNRSLIWYGLGRTAQLGLRTLALILFFGVILGVLCGVPFLVARRLSSAYPNLNALIKGHPPWDRLARAPARITVMALFAVGVAIAGVVALAGIEMLWHILERVARRA